MTTDQPGLSAVLSCRFRRSRLSEVVRIRCCGSRVAWSVRSVCTGRLWDMHELDTTVEARRVQLEAYRSMSATERLRLGFVLSDDVQRVADAGASAREPHQPST